MQLGINISNQLFYSLKKKIYFLQVMRSKKHELEKIMHFNILKVKIKKS